MTTVMPPIVVEYDHQSRNGRISALGRRLLSLSLVLLLFSVVSWQSEYTAAVLGWEGHVSAVGCVISHGSAEFAYVTHSRIHRGFSTVFVDPRVE